jgi:hypothetical protein
MSGTSKGQTFDLRDEVYTIGRSPDNNIQILDKTVSRRHLKIFSKNNEYYIEDLKSRNGTFVNGARVQAGEEIKVKRGVPLAVGRVFLHLSGEYKEDDVVDKELQALDSIDLSKELGNGGAELVKDRPMTHQKNMSLIAKVNDVLREALGINEILEQMLNYILDFFTRIDRGFFILFDHETGKIKEVVKVFNRDEDEVPSRYSRTIVDRVRREKKPVLMLDTLNEESAEISESMKLMKIKSVMCVPLISRSKIRGVIYVDTAVVIESAILSLTKEKSQKS